jgi:hypothetical protein
MKPRTVEVDELLQMLTETLGQCDGDFIAEICNKVMTETVTYDSDSFFTLTSKD